MGAASLAAPTGSRIASLLDSLEILPTSLVSAARVLALTNDPDSDMSEFADAVGIDPALTAKVLALVNSAFYGVSRSVTSVRQAVTLIGTHNLRVLSVTYCLAGLHHQWRLPQNAAHDVWEASVCKAAAAALVARGIPGADEGHAFSAALLSDIGITLLLAAGQERYAEILRNTEIDIPRQMALEREQFGEDHASLSGRLAALLRLPEPLRSDVAVHHALGPESGGPSLPARIAALLPHSLYAWRAADHAALAALLSAEAGQRWSGLDAFVAELQGEFERVSRVCNPGCGAAPSLAELSAQAAAMATREATRLVAQNAGLLNQNIALLGAKENAEARAAELETRALLDPLTRLLNRDGMKESFAESLRDDPGSSVAVLLIDLDDFKRVNDVHGHCAGDAVLVECGRRVTAAARDADLVTRWGGDEFVVVLRGLQQGECGAIAARLHAAICGTPAAHNGVTIPLSVSIGASWAQSPLETPLEALIERADAVMYEAKHAHGRTEQR
ncbi:MAG: HDOD domain-containing protein [Planctomycetia bacterium]|nr:MAG: HDOD domain-containing protein [Planctomycetia bacterium]